MIYLTSDLHIGHNKPFIYETRGFSSIEEHDTAILKNWNNVVTDEDTVYILGDLCLGQDEKEWNRIFYNLKGKEINIIIGNHDTNNKIDKYIFDYEFVDCGWVTILKYSKKWKFYLSHYPTYTENPVSPHEKPIINLYGHTHQKDFFFNGNPYMYNVGIDAHNLTPVSIETIIKDIQKGI